MNQINADSISNVALTASSKEVSELADLETGIAYPAALSRSADGDAYLVRIGNRQPFAVAQQSIPAPLRQVIAQVMADTTSSLTNNTTTSTPSRAVSIPMQATISATQQLQLNPLANVSMTPVQQLQVLQQLAGVSNRRTSWDLQLDKSTVTAKLASGDVAAGSGIAAPAPRASGALPAGASSAALSTANSSNAQQAQSSLPAQGESVTVRLQASATQWQVQWQPPAASAFQALSGVSQQQILALVSEQLGGDSLQWAQLPEAFKRQLEQLSPALAKALAQSALPMKLNLDGQSAGLQPSSQQAVPLSANQFSALVPQQAVASPQSSVTISEAARAAMAKDTAAKTMAAKDMAAALASASTSNNLAAGHLADNKSTESATPAPRAASQPGSNSQTPAAASVAKTNKAPTAEALVNESAQHSAAIDEQSSRVTSAKVQPAASQAQPFAGKPLTAAQLTASQGASQGASPEPAAQTYDKKMSSTAGSSISTGQRMATQVASDRQPSVMSASSGFAASNPAEKVLANSAARQSIVDDAAATQANSAADAKIATKAQQAAATHTSSIFAPSKAQLDLPSHASYQHASSNQISAQNPNATVGHTATPKPTNAANQHETLSNTTTPDVSKTPEVSPAVSLNVLSKAELLRQLLQLLTPLWQAKQAEHAGSTIPPTALAELADPLSLPSGTAPHRPLLQQVQQSMLEPQLLSEARLQQELNAALLFNPLQPAMTTSAAGTLAVAMQLLLGRLGVPLPENHKSDKTQKLKDAIQQLELGQVRDTLKQLASHASAYQAAQLETLAQQKTEQNNWFFQLPLPFQGQSQFAELAVEQRAARKANGQTTALWHLTLALEVAPYGRVVMEGALGPDSNSLQFYTASSELKLKIEKYGVILRDRLKLQGVPIAQFQCTVGELPAHLAQKPSSLFQVKA